MTGGIRVPVKILDTKYALSKSALAVIIALYDTAQSVGQKTLTGYEVKVRLSTLASRCRVDVRTVSRCIASLIGRGLIIGRARTVRKDRTCGTYIYALPAERTYFFLSRTAFRLILDAAPQALKTYLYCVNSAGNSRSFYHSFSDMATSLGTKRSDIMKHIAVLEQLRLIQRRRKSFLRQPRRLTENTYIVFLCGRISRIGKTSGKSVIKKLQRTAGTPTSTLRSHPLSNIIHRSAGFVKCFTCFFEKIFRHKRRRCFSLRR